MAASDPMAIPYPKILWGGWGAKGAWWVTVKTKNTS